MFYLTLPTLVSLYAFSFSKAKRVQAYLDLYLRNRNYSTKIYQLGEILARIVACFEYVAHIISISPKDKKYTGNESNKTMNSTVESEINKTLSEITGKLDMIVNKALKAYGDDIVVLPFFRGELIISDLIPDDFYSWTATDILYHNGSIMHYQYNKIHNVFVHLTKNCTEMSLWLQKQSVTWKNISNMCKQCENLYLRITKTDDLIINVLNILSGNSRYLDSFMKEYKNLLYAISHDSKVHLSKRTFELNDDFFKENIAVLTIYFSELSTFRVIQQKTDSFTSLICDLGGSLGLYLGGSLLTIVEIIDILLGYSYKKLYHTPTSKSK